MWTVKAGVPKTSKASTSAKRPPIHLRPVVSIPRSRGQNDYLTSMRLQDIVLPTKDGVYCALGGFYIDPTRPVDKAVITHGHSDHARAGHGAVLATQETLDLMRLRYGETFAGRTQAAAYGEEIGLGDVR